MVQFLSINFFSWISSIFVGFFKSSRFFFVTLYIQRRNCKNVESVGKVSTVLEILKLITGLILAKIPTNVKSVVLALVDLVI